MGLAGYCLVPPVLLVMLPGSAVRTLAALLSAGSL